MNSKHSNYLLVFIVAGVLFGGTLGYFFPEQMTSVAWLGDMFLSALKMLIVPLVFSAVLVGVASLGDVRSLGRMGGMTVSYYFITTSIAVVVGLFVVNLIEPGVGVSTLNAIPDSVAGKENIGITDIVQSLVSKNLIDSAARTDILPLIIFAIAFACALTVIGKPGEPVLAFFRSFNEGIMKLVIWLMYLAPIGIFALVAGRLSLAQLEGGFMNEIIAVGQHVFTVMLGLTLHFAILFAILVFIANRGWEYFMGMLRALLTALGTSSSSATLPVTMECSQAQGVDKKSAQFVLPLGSTVNMDGTALYEACAALFIAQVYGIELSFIEQVLVFITATLAAIGAAGIPEAGLVTLVIVLGAVGLPLEGIGLLLSVDWFLDRFRTTVNVWGDSVGAAILNRFVGSKQAARG